MKITSLDETRHDLVLKFKELGFTVGAEIGVDRGLYAEEICKANPSVRLFCIDPWKIYKENTDYFDQHILNVNCLNTGKRLAPYNCEIIRKSSMSAIKEFEDNSLDFVYIDANHNFKYVLEDIQEWSKKVKTGGIISGHDYIWQAHRRPKYDVKNALDVHLQETDKELFLLTAKRGSSWYYVK